MSLRYTFGSLLCVVVLSLFGGCSSDKGQTSVQWMNGQPAAMTKAAEPGNYALYLGNSTDAVVVQKLKQGEQLGFERNDVGRVRAVAGSYSTTLDPMTIGQARWELMVPPQKKAPTPEEMK